MVQRTLSLTPDTSLHADQSDGHSTFGRFKLPDGNHKSGRYNLSESTVQSLRLGEMMAMADGTLDDLAMDYGDPSGLPALRVLLGRSCARSRSNSSSGTRSGRGAEVRVYDS